MATPAKRTVSRKDYRKYMQSRAWRTKREQYWASKLSKNCYVCNSRRQAGFHLHHRSYKNLGNERLTDLVPACPDCHKFIHAYIDSTGLNLWEGTQKAKIAWLVQNGKIVPPKKRKKTPARVVRKP